MSRSTTLLLVLNLSLHGCTNAASDDASAPSRGTDGGSTGSYGGASGSGGKASSGGMSSASGGSTGSSPGASGAAGSSGSAGSPSSEDGAASGGSGSSIPPRAGLLTAGAWDDNENFQWFMAYRNRLQSSAAAFPVPDDEHVAAFNAFLGAPGPRRTLDVALVIDTTGSMGDEIRYLQDEFLALSSTIEHRYPAAEQRWSLIVYRDVGDDYVVRSFDFSSDLPDFQTDLAAQAAGGGGDFPEAPDQALASMAQLSWRSDPATARLAFWAADAPHHDGDAPAMAQAIRAARALDVHVYPVASSGVDELTELTMRSAAQLTGGRYLFLTDDSGVGGAHKEPSIPCYFVTRLNDAIYRMIDIELSGVHREPSADEIIRTGGDPQNRACTASTGETLLAY